MFIVQLRIIRRSSKTHEESLILSVYDRQSSLVQFSWRPILFNFWEFQWNHSMERHGSLLDQLNARRLKIIERSM